MTLQVPFYILILISCRRGEIPTKVLHINDVAGVACDLRRYQQSKNIDSILMAHKRYSMCQPDMGLHLDGLLGVNLELLAKGHLFRKMDVVHVHAGIRRTQFALPLLKNRSKAKWILHYHGSETRMGYGMAHQEVADAKLVSTPDLLSWHKGAIWLPVPIPELELGAANRIGTGLEKIRVGHFPSNRSLKGTSKIVHALEPLVASGRIELIIVEGKTKHDAIELMRTMDLVIDQLSELRIFSKVALEAMAQGIPALSSYDQEIFPLDCPVIPVQSEKDLAERVDGMISHNIDEELRRRSMDYVRRYHDPRKVIDQLDEIYSEL
jgi:hypothetical protein